jgi:hypothetical protein
VQLLIGTAHGTPDLLVSTRLLPFAAGSRTVDLGPVHRLRGARSLRARLRIVAFDSAGQRTARTIAFVVR